MQTTKDESLSQRKKPSRHFLPAKRSQACAETRASARDRHHPPAAHLLHQNPLVTLSIKKKRKTPLDLVPIAASPLIYLSGRALVHLFIYSPRLFVYVSHATLPPPPFDSSLRGKKKKRDQHHRVLSPEWGHRHTHPELMMSCAAGLSQDIKEFETTLHRLMRLMPCVFHVTGGTVVCAREP